MSPPPKKSIKLSTSVNSPVRSNTLQATGVIYENTDITRKVEEEYQRKKKEELNQTAQINMKKNKEASKSIVMDSGKAKNPKEC